jgi:hypothetical protein
MPKAADTDWRVEMCTTCQYCKAGYCYRFPPVRMRLGTFMGDMTYYPKVEEKQACGEYKI